MKVPAGSVLIAEPFLNDPNFERTVVFLCSNDDKGSFGFVINQPQTLLMSDLIENCKINIPVFFGGPVDTNSLHFLHRYIEHSESENEISPGVFWGGDFDQIYEQLNQGLLDPSGIRFFLGYSGWDAGQLDSELDLNTWIVSTVSADVIFAADPQELWRKVLRDMGGSFKLMSLYPKDPRLN